MKVIDLFCGAGGFSLGFKQAGFDIILGVDNWEMATRTYAKNIGARIWKRDVTNLDPESLPECDVLIGSPPCPDFSVARYRGGGWDERKADLSCVDAFYLILNHLKPKFWIWENVMGVDKYLFFQPSAMLDAQEFGVLQRRKRIFVGNFPMPKKKKAPKNYTQLRIAPTIIAWELCGGWKGNARTRRFSKWLGRKPTIDEMVYYMGFPCDYEFFGNKQEMSIQIGNAVCPPVAKALAEACLTKLNKTLIEK